MNEYNVFKPKGLEALDYSGNVIHKFPENKSAIIKMTHELKGFILLKYISDNDFENGDSFDNINFDLGFNQAKNERTEKRVSFDIMRLNCTENEALLVSKTL